MRTRQNTTESTGSAQRSPGWESAAPTGARCGPGELLREAAERLRPVSETPRLDGELLLAHALGIRRAALYALGRNALDRARRARFGEMLTQRADGRPVAQIIGRKEFFSLDFEITPHVLTPRPETELLVEVVSGHLAASGEHPSCLELGTGSGAVAVTLTRLQPGSRIVATDVCAEALDVARRNAARLAPGRIRFAQGCWYDAVQGERRFDAIAANPPYVESRLCRAGPLGFEPRRALDGGAAGLRHLRAVISGAPQFLRHTGMLAVEHGAGQGTAVRELMSRAGLTEPVSHRDLAGHERISVARRS